MRDSWTRDLAKQDEQLIFLIQKTTELKKAHKDDEMEEEGTVSNCE